MKKVVIMLLMAFAILYADPVPHMILEFVDTNKVEVVDAPNYVEYIFDAKMYVTGNTEPFKISQFTLWIQYPTAIFNDNIYTNGNVSYEMTDYLSQTLFGGAISGYYEENAEQTNKSYFAITFTASVNAPDQYTAVSELEASPSGLARITFKAYNSGAGKIFIPNYVPLLYVHDFDDVAYNMDLGYYEDALNPNISPVTAATDLNAIVNVSIEEIDDPTPIFIKESALSFSKGSVSVNWTTSSEIENIGFIVKRSLVQNGADEVPCEIISSYLNNDDLHGSGTTSQENKYSFIDKNVQPGKQYKYYVEDVDYSGKGTTNTIGLITIPENSILMGDDYEFSASYPNPFNPVFIVPFNLYRAKTVSIKMYDVAGKLVRTVADGYMEAGDYKLVVNGSELSSGVYFLKTSIETQHNTQKMLLVK